MAEPQAGEHLPRMLALAREAMTRAYAPYSSFPVGAALLGANGRVYAGCNVENAAYPQGACAEAGAIGAMIAGGERLIAEILVIGDGDALVTPCGGCRQRIREFAALDAPIHIAGPEGLRAAQHRLDACHQLSRLEGLGDVVIGTETQRAHDIALIGAGGQHDHRHGGYLTNAPAYLHAIEAGHVGIEHDQLRRILLEPPPALLAIVGGQNLVSLTPQDVREEIDQVTVIIDH